MLAVFKSENNLLQELEIDNIQSGSWINMVKPSEDELNKVSEVTNVPVDFLNPALDENEHSRIEIEDNCILFIINVPLMLDKNSFDTLPLGIVITESYIITVCLKDNNIISNFNKSQAKNFSTDRKVRFLLQILLKSAELYLRYMRYINQLTDNIELGLRKSMKNKALFQLFDLERSLIYFITALKDNGMVTAKIERLVSNQNLSSMLKLHEEDEELLEDVIIENRQAIEMVEMHSNILSSMMDAFASIISNNLNMVMKVLTSFTILIAIPTMIASFWGMNVDVPFRAHLGGFVYVVTFSFLATSITALLLVRKKMLF